MPYHLQLQEKHFRAIQDHADQIIGLSALVSKLAEDDIVVVNVSVSRPQDAGVPITVVRDGCERYLEVQRAPWPISPDSPSIEIAIVQY